MRRLDKVVLITGATSGIGKAAALAFDRSGARLALAARRTDILSGLASSMRDALAVPTDLAEEDQVRAMVDRTVSHFGRLDVLINNAAQVHFARSSTISPEVLKRAFQVNVLGPLVAAQRAVAVMRRQGGGQIINVGSPGFFIGVPFLAPYMASKAALCGLTRTLQAEWEESGVILTEYLPGYILTESIPDSEFGRLGQDVFADPGQNALLRLLARPKPASAAADDLLNAVYHPRRVIYSGFGVRLGVWLSNLAAFRRSTGARMTRTFLKRLKTTVFE
ncbi:MAG: SDR family oxidoreductase [Pseudomonadota bacterium]